MLRYEIELLRAIAVAARRRTGRLAAELVRAPSEEREDVFAALEFERWLAECAEEALADD